jgi:hypothetical protein
MWKEFLEETVEEQRATLTRLQDMADSFGQFAIANTKAAVEIHERNVSAAVARANRLTDGVMQSAGVPENVRQSIIAAASSYQRNLFAAALIAPSEVEEVARKSLAESDAVGRLFRKKSV